MPGLGNSSGTWSSVLLGAALLCSGAAFASAQSQQATQNQQTTQPSAPPAQTAPPAPSAKPPTNKPNSAAPAPSDDNAFPEAESEAAQKKAEAAQNSADQNSSDSNAFPEAKSEAAQKQAESSGSAGAPPPANGEPYSSSRSRDANLNDLLGTNDSPVSDGAGHFLNNPKLAKEDVRVGKFYLAQGNYAGAYMRLKEATEVGQGNLDAVYLLAEAARKTSHLDEAETNYKLYLDVEPNGKYAKDSLKALKQLAGN